jgi:hypothetical protein
MYVYARVVLVYIWKELPRSSRHRPLAINDVGLRFAFIRFEDIVPYC